jgi:hypothetical protein
VPVTSPHRAAWTRTVAVVSRPRVSWTVLSAWALLWALLMARHGGVSWHYFQQGGLALADADAPGGALHVYATHPELQFGPVSMAAAALLVPLGVHASLVAAQTIGALLGLLLLWLVGSTARALAPLGFERKVRLQLLVAGLAFLPVWMNLAVRFVHLDDVLALVFVVAATWSAVNRRPVPAALLLGLAAGAKPWALPFVVLALGLGRRDRGRVLAIALGVAGVVWLPFFVFDPASVLAARYAIPTAAASSLHVLGVSSPVTPGWDRPLQMLLGAALAGVAVKRGRWPAAVLLVVGIRVVLDPGAYSYYTAGIVVGALLWDLLGSRQRVPYWTLTATASLFATHWLPLTPLSQGVIRVVFVATCVLVLALPPRTYDLPGTRMIVRLPVGRALAPTRS